MENYITPSIGHVGLQSIALTLKHWMSTQFILLFGFSPLYPSLIHFKFE